MDPYGVKHLAYAFHRLLCDGCYDGACDAETCQNISLAFFSTTDQNLDGFKLIWALFPAESIYSLEWDL